MPAIRMTIRLPEELWQAVQLLAPDEGDANTVVIRALEEYLLQVHHELQKGGSGKYKKLVDALSMPVETLNLSARATTCLQDLHIRYIYELVAKEPRELRMMRNFGERSFREVRDKLAALGLALGVTPDNSSYIGAVLGTVTARIAAAPE